MKKTSYPKSNMRIENTAGIEWTFSQGSNESFGLGACFFNDELLEIPLSKGIFFLRNIKTSEIIWLGGAKSELLNKQSIKITGSEILEGVDFLYNVSISLAVDLPVAKLEFQYSVDKPLIGWEVGFSLHDQFSHSWNGHIYPFAEDAKAIREAPLIYVGIPSILLMREDYRCGMLFGFDLDFDYLNPTTWTGDCGLYFTDGVIPAQFRVGSQGLKPGLVYSWPLNLVLSDIADPVKMIPDLVANWIKYNNYSIEDLFVRSADSALKTFVQGRRHTTLWNTGVGYQLEEGDPSSNFVYLGEQPLSAYFEYLLYEETGDLFWRQRCFEQMDFVLKGQVADQDDVNFGVFHTAYDLGKQAFDSDDRGSNIGFKPDLNTYMARYMLMTWKRVKEKEGIDRQDWYQSAVSAANWVLRQRNADGGLPQVVRYPFVYMEGENDTTDKYFHKSISATPGRALAAFPEIYEITGDERYLNYALELEDFVRRHVESRLRFTGHHPDLPPDEIEEASIWGVIEYWLDKYDRTQDSECLERALADAYLSLLWWCPKQLSWVKNPTQCASAEQQHFLQYSIYCYQNRKLECLHRLYELTNNELFSQLYDRVMQGIFWTQIEKGALRGAAHERIADPWLVRDDNNIPADFNSQGTIYIGEQILDTMLQLVEMGIAKLND